MPSPCSLVLLAPLQEGLNPLFKVLRGELGTDDTKAEPQDAVGQAHARVDSVP